MNCAQHGAPPLPVLCSAGSIRIYQFRGEEALNNVTVTDVGINKAAYIQQGERELSGALAVAVVCCCVPSGPFPCPSFTGAYHMVENTSNGAAKFLQIFDHPQGGAVFAAPALAALHNYGVGQPNNAEKIVSSSFTADIFPDTGTLVQGKPPLVNFGTCTW